MTLMSLLMKGGWTMVAIGVSLFVGIYFAIERYIYFRRASSPVDELLKRAKAWVKEGAPEEAVKDIKRYDTPLARVMMKGIVTGRAEAVDGQAAEEVKKFESGLGVIASVGAIAPMLGFFGTVLGMIKAFMQIEILGGGVNPSRLAGGIWEALVTTAAGLAVGIIFLLIYNSFTEKLSSYINDMKKIRSELDVLMGESYDS